MADREDDLRAFIQAFAARSDRIIRENSRVIDRMERAFARNDAVIEKALARIDEDHAEMRQWRAERRVEMIEEREERRAVIDAIMRLIDRIDHIDPGAATA